MGLDDMLVECGVLEEKSRDSLATLNEAAENHVTEMQQLKADHITEVSSRCSPHAFVLIVHGVCLTYMFVHEHENVRSKFSG